VIKLITVNRVRTYARVSRKKREREMRILAAI